MSNSEISKAASWVVFMAKGAERTRLYDGHRLRRVPGMKYGCVVEDCREADAWLVHQWKLAGEP